MSEDVRSDAELLCNLLDSGVHVQDRVTGRVVVLCTKAVAEWTDRSVQMISQYRNGQTNIPAEFWKRVLEHHFDPRVFNLFVPDAIDLEWAVRGSEVNSAPDFFRQAVKLEGQHHEAMKYIAELLADGRIDELDAATVQKYHEAYLVHRTLDRQLNIAIRTKFFAEQGRKAGAR